MNITLQPVITKEQAMECAALMASLEPWKSQRNYGDRLKLFLNRSLDTYFIKDEEKIMAFCIAESNILSGTVNKLSGVYSNYVNADLQQRMLQMLDEKLKGQPHQSGIYVTDDRNKMDVDFIYNNLKELYWATNLTRENLIGRMMNSMCFGVFADDQQKGFARVVTDFFSFAYLADVFVEEKERGKGYSRVLMDYILDYPLLRDIKWLLATRDCHALYEKFGFTPVNDPGRFMGKNGWKSLT